MKKLIQGCIENQETLLVTFEVFWILVFLLEAASSASGPEVAGFVYANF